MHIFNIDDSPSYDRNGVISHLLVSTATTNSKHLTATEVTVPKSTSQALHSHDEEQLYYILEGAGEMTVGSEILEIKVGDCVFIPGGQEHGLRNSGSSNLRYFSCSAPVVGGIERLQNIWPDKFDEHNLTRQATGQ